MPTSHPHAEASYRIVALDADSFGVEVSVPDAHPATVSKFASHEAAEAWITAHRDRVQSQTYAGRGFRGSGRGVQRSS